MSANPQMEKLAAMLLQQMQQATQPDPNVEEHTKQSNQSNDLVNEIMKSMIGQVSGGGAPKGPEVPKELQEIVDALISQPRLIPAVQKFTARLVRHVSAAVDKAMGEAESGNIPPDAPA